MHTRHRLLARVKQYTSISNHNTACNLLTQNLLQIYCFWYWTYSTALSHFANKVTLRFAGCTSLAKLHSVKDIPMEDSIFSQLEELIRT